MDNCIIVDDDYKSLSILKYYIHEGNSLNLLACFTDAFNALDYTQENSVDLIFLDIEMNGLNGLRFTEEILERQKPALVSPYIIFTSGHLRYAIDGYNYQNTVINFLHKPVDQEDLNKAIDNYVLLKSQAASFLKTSEGLIKINIKDILCIASERNNVRVVDIYGNHYLTRSEYEETRQLLSNHTFLRIHRSYLVAKDKIHSLNKNKIKLKNHSFWFPVGPKYKDQVNSFT